MGGLALKIVSKKGKDVISTTHTSLWDIAATDIDGNKIERLGNIV